MCSTSPTLTTAVELGPRQGHGIGQAPASPLPFVRSDSHSVTSLYGEDDGYRTAANTGPERTPCHDESPERTGALWGTHYCRSSLVGGDSVGRNAVTANERAVGRAAAREHRHHDGIQTYVSQTGKGHTAEERVSAYAT